ncbi:paraquat-inducible protein A [Salipiger sp. H15]|uniref:Paraquat-inducible protein A n=1 Tax=Alloyangia sp. H15 TaxID=3029062 RepID=A0AAU8ANI8_9RHOB
MLKYANLALFLLYPVAWVAPLMRAGLLPLFGLSEISVISGIVTLWHSDVFLALVVALFALVAPMVKIGGLALVQFGLVSRRALPVINGLGKLAMADIFLVAVYVTLIKGMGVGRIETGWGLYLFTFCVLASLALGMVESRKKGD